MGDISAWPLTHGVVQRSTPAKQSAQAPPVTRNRRASTGIRGIALESRLTRSPDGGPLMGWKEMTHGPPPSCGRRLWISVSGVGSTHTSRSPVMRGRPWCASAYAPTTRKRTSAAIHSPKNERRWLITQPPPFIADCEFRVQTGWPIQQRQSVSGAGTIERRISSEGPLPRAARDRAGPSAAPTHACWRRNPPARRNRRRGRRIGPVRATSMRLRSRARSAA